MSPLRETSGWIGSWGYRIARVVPRQEFQSPLPHSPPVSGPSNDREVVVPPLLRPAEVDPGRSGAASRACRRGSGRRRRWSRCGRSPGSVTKAEARPPAGAPEGSTSAAASSLAQAAGCWKGGRRPVGAGLAPMPRPVGVPAGVALEHLAWCGWSPPAPEPGLHGLGARRGAARLIGLIGDRRCDRPCGSSPASG